MWRKARRATGDTQDENEHNLNLWPDKRFHTQLAEDKCGRLTYRLSLRLQLHAHTHTEIESE